MRINLNFFKSKQIMIFKNENFQTLNNHFHVSHPLNCVSIYVLAWEKPEEALGFCIYEARQKSPYTFTPIQKTPDFDRSGWFRNREF